MFSLARKGITPHTYTQNPALLHHPTIPIQNTSIRKDGGISDTLTIYENHQ